jgi:hypothetical protein
VNVTGKQERIEKVNNSKTLVFRKLWIILSYNLGNCRVYYKYGKRWEWELSEYPYYPSIQGCIEKITVR